MGDFLLRELLQKAAEEDYAIGALNLQAIQWAQIYPQVL
jgi:fructose/tagatose bisphosphate aldolase